MPYRDVSVFSKADHKEEKKTSYMFADFLYIYYNFMLKIQLNRRCKAILTQYPTELVRPFRQALCECETKKRTN